MPPTALPGPASKLLPEPPTRAVSTLLAAWALALLLGLQPIATDLYLPGLPLLARELGASMSAATQTMAALVLAFGLGQLVWGPLADRFGRRPVLCIGLVLFCLASVGCALAPGIHALVGWRALQGAALAAAIVCARAMLRDLYEPHEGARVMSIALTGLGAIALVGPPLGGFITATAGWRATLGTVAVCGAAVLTFVVLALPETLQHKNPHATRPLRLWAAWRHIAGHPSFQAWAALIAATYGGLFTLLAGSSFVYMDVLHLSPAQYGLALASCSAVYIVATFFCRRWIVRHGMVKGVAIGARFSLAGGLVMAALALAGFHNIWALLLPQWLYCFGHGIHQPVGQAAVVGPFPQHAGAASALAGFLLAAVAFGVGLWLGRALDGTVLPLALGMGFWAVLTSAAAWWLVPRAQRLAVA
jgi:MFS transporter, DHA1 family, multidrug resistance protein